MSVQDAFRFVKKMYEDEEFRKHVVEVSDADRPGFVKASGFDFTKQELQTVYDAAAGRLSDEDLEQASAGVDLQDRPQLGTQALAFAGQTEQSVLRLFG